MTPSRPTTSGSTVNLLQVRHIVKAYWWPSTVISVLAAELWFSHSGLRNFHACYDSGVYLESARMMRRGYPQYTAIFGSQPPLWLLLLRYSFSLFGESFLTGHLVSAAASLVNVGALVVLVMQLQDRVSATIAALLLIFAPLELAWSRSVIADVPSTAFSTLAMALVARYFTAGRRLWLMLTGLAIALSILIKLSGVYILPPVLFLLSAKWIQEDRLDAGARVSGLCRDLLILSAIIIGLVMLLASACELPHLWNQVILFHLRARLSAEAGDASRIVLSCWPQDGPVQILTALAALCIFGGWRGWVLLVWAICTFLGLQQQRPLSTHHLLALIPAFAAAAAFGWGEFRTAVLKCCNRTADVRLGRSGSVAMGICLVLGFLVPIRLWMIAQANSYFEFAAETDRTPMDLAVRDRLQQLTRADDSILTDAQGIAFLAHRDVPPGLTDTSFKRIAAGYLSEQQVIDEATKSEVRAALLWTGRLASMPSVIAWVKSHFPHHYDFGNGRELYFMLPTENAEPFD